MGMYQKLCDGYGGFTRRRGPDEHSTHAQTGERQQVYTDESGAQEARAQNVWRIAQHRRVSSVGVERLCHDAVGDAHHTDRVVGVEQVHSNLARRWTKG